MAFLVISAFLTSACAEAELDIGAVGRLSYHGRVSRIETLGRYSRLESTLLLQFAGPPAKLSTETDYYLYRVIYPTAGIHGGITTVSGLIAVPVTRAIKGIVSWHHGTKSFRDFSVSEPTLEGLGTAAVFAADGYILAAADYIGLGVSEEMQGYYDWPSTVSTIVDLISIAEVMLDAFANHDARNLYLTGFSQGGGATAAVQRELERSNPTQLILRGAAAISGAFDLRNISFPHAMDHDDTFHLGFIATSLAYVYQQPLSGVVRKPYAEQLPDWFDGSKDPDFLKNHLPGHLSELLTEEFLAGYAQGTEEPAWFYEALRAGMTADYAPKAPLRLFFASADTIVTPEESIRAFHSMQELDGNVESVALGPYDHEESILRALPPIQRWFDELQQVTGK